MKRNTPTLLAATLWSILAFLALSLSSLRADQVVLGAGSAAGGGGHSPGYTDSGLGSTSGGWTGTASTVYQSTVSNPSRWVSGVANGVLLNNGGSVADSKPWIQLAPALAANGGGGTYVIYGTRGSDVGNSSDNVWSIACTDCTTPTATTTFWQIATRNAWNPICTVTLNAGITTPTVLFTFHSGNSSRTISDSYYFGQVTDGTGTADCGGMLTPVFNTDTAVTVTGCSGSATAVKIVDTSANTTVGTLSETPDWGGGTVSVPVSGLIPGNTIKAIQTIAGVDSRLSIAPSTVVQSSGGAADRTWSGGGGNNLWSTAANWGGTAPVAGDGVIFDGSTRLTPDLDMDSMSVRLITFNSGAGSFTLGSTSGKSLALTGDITQSSANSQTISLPIALNSTPSITATGPLNLSGVISSGGAFTKNGASTLTLSGGSANTYSGGTMVSVGTLDVQKDGGLGVGNVTVASGATLKLGSGTLNTYIDASANLLLQSGTPSVNLAFLGADIINKLSFDGGTTFQAAGSWGAVGSGADHTDAHFAGTGLLRVQTRTWSGLGADDNWTTPGNWAAGLAPLTSGDALEFAGGIRTTPVMNGTYSLSSLKFNGGAAAFTLTGSGGTLAAAVITNASANNQVISANITQGAVGLLVDTGTKQLTLSGDVEGTGGYTVNGSGTLYLNNTANGIGGPTIVSNGATLRLADFSDLGANDGVQALTLDGGTLRNDDTVTGTGHQFLYWATACTLGAGGGTFNLTAPATTELVYGNYPGRGDGRALAGVGQLTKTGTGTLVLSNTTPNTYSGGTLVQQGKITVKKDGNLGSGDVTVASGATLELTAPTQFPATAKLLLQSGSPLVILTYSGANTVAQLSFDGGATFQASGTWGSSASGAANVDDSRFSGTGQLDVTTGPAISAVTSFSIALGGGGALNLSYSGGAGSRFVLLSNNIVNTASSTWARIATNTSTPNSFTITRGTGPASFFRVVSE